MSADPDVRVGGVDVPDPSVGGPVPLVPDPWSLLDDGRRRLLDHVKASAQEQAKGEELERTFRALDTVVSRAVADTRALTIGRRARRLWDLDPEVPSFAQGRSAPLSAYDAQLMRTRAGELAQEIRDAIHRAGNQRFVQHQEQQAVAALRTLRVLERDVRATVTHAVDKVESIRAEAQRSLLALRAELEGTLELERLAAEQWFDQVARPMAGWDASVWQRTGRQVTYPRPDGLLLGYLRPEPMPELGPAADFGRAVRIPYVVDPSEGLLIGTDRWSRDEANAAARGLVLRMLDLLPAGAVKLTIVDPVGLGSSAGDLLELAEYDPGLIDGKVWSSADDIAARLRFLTAHLELVTQKYLRTQYESLADYNGAADEVAEPYRVLLVFDAPTGLTESMFDELVRITHNGPRCGVFTILVAGGAGDALPRGRSLEELSVTRTYPGHRYPHGLAEAPYTCTLEPQLDTDLDAAVRRSVIDTAGRGAAASERAPVTLDRTLELFAKAAGRGIDRSVPAGAVGLDPLDPDTWWPLPTVRAVTAPIGKRGATDVATLTLDSEAFSGVLLVGRPGSGKSTLLHTLIAGMTTLHSPEELELHLVDFREGVEFATYAAHGLPHARSIAIESDREFGLSVLRSLRDEITRRGSLLRGTENHHASLSTLRSTTGELLPRVVLVFDEFQVLLARTDKVGMEAAGLLEELVRQGRGFGIHLVLATQSIAGLDALGSHVLPLLPVRLLLPSSEADARKVLGDGNAAGELLTQHGEGILNDRGGTVSANVQFKAAFTTEEERADRVRALRAKADAAGFVRRPVVYEGNVRPAADSISAEQFAEETRSAADGPLRMRIGAPMSLSQGPDIELRREPGANVLVVARDADAVPGEAPASPAHSILALTLAGAASTGTPVDVLDWTPVDSGLHDHLLPALAGGTVTVHRRRTAPAAIGQALAAVRQRHADQSFRAPRRLVVLFGVHRARELSTDGSVDADDALLDQIVELLRDGPEVGVHALVWVDSVTGLGRRLPSSATRECAWRVAGQMSEDDSHQLLGVGEAATLRPTQLLVVNDDVGFSRRYRAFAVPGREWLARAAHRPGGATRG